ncbi:MAG: hypothetical protein UC662_00805 [Paraprevotella clara]|nr:hypothetical protein [Paraprevotella clara]
MKRFYILGVAMGMSAFLSSLFGCHVSDGDFRSLSVAEFKEPQIRNRPHKMTQRSKR